ncbi:MAG: hormogonium polysaccharide biosynthesis protein HpsA, partial [Coleofasciculus sp. C2-GNP5-27]
DSRQIQGIDEDDLETTKVESVADLTGEYDLSIEERQPLEIRATKIDLDLLRKTTISGSVNGPTPEYLLPNSGIIYASRDDAQPDLSSLDHDQLLGEKLTPTEKAEKLRESAVDYKLDPTRRPNGILLFNGKKLARADSELFREAEKGLTLVTNLPAYVWAWSDSNGDGIVDDTDEPVFNPHSKEEFDRTLNPNWNNFYNRGEPDENFACRPNDPRLPKCTTGDTWRPATVIADSMTLLSRDFRFGFRNEGDYDLRNNNPGNQATINNRRRNGFFANTYATNGLSSQNPAAFETRNFTDATYSNRTNLPDNSSSSYFNNFVTPVQRRRNNVPEYVMEICRKFPVSECQPQDWVIGYDSDGDGILAPGEANVRIDQLQPQITNSGGPNIATLINWTTPYGGGGSPLDRLGAGTTAQPALNPADQRYARRVAFARTSNQMLVLDGTGAAQPIGVGCPLTGCVYPTVPRTVANALWFRTTTNTAGNPGLATDISYRDNQPLYYETDAFKYGPAVQYAGTETVKYVEDSTGVSSAAGVNPVRLFIPITPEDSAYEFPLLSQLNSGTDPVSGYFMCLGSGTVKAEPGNTQLSSVSIAGSCPGNINPLRNALLQLNPATPNDAIVQPAGALPNLIAESTSDAAPNPNSFKSVNVYDLGTSLGGNITLEGTPDSIFVLRIPANSSLTFAADTQITLDGVNPNNIFWVFGNNSDVIFEAGAQIAGNFIGHGGGNIQFPASNNVQVLGGRFLGFGDVLNNAGTSITGAPIDFANPVNPITSQDQPLLVPVLQLHSPNVDNQGWTGIDVQGRVLGSRWLPPATETETTFNLITAVGNTPPRPGEPDGGAATFVRLVEDWFGTDLSISGSLMEFNRSSIATGPFQPFVQTGTFFDNQGGIFNYPQKYATDNSDGKLPSYQRANRGFGYDVGLLSQLPDLFSGRFTTPPAGAPNEFFQEVNRDEDQIKTLLCAGVINNADDQNATAYQTSNRAVNTTYVPDGCPNLSDY